MLLGLLRGVVVINVVRLLRGVVVIKRCGGC
jgi:hypothetical protein